MTLLWPSAPTAVLWPPTLRRARLQGWSVRPLLAARRALSALLLPGMTAFLVGGIVSRRGGGIVKPFCFFPHDAATNETLQRTQFAVILVGDKTDGVADGVRASGAADAMDVILRVHREIVIDDM